MAKIEHVMGREILDSRGFPTLEVEVHASGGHRGRASVPSGASCGTYEAHELRDNDKRRYGGKGVLRAISHIEKVLLPQLIGKDVCGQEAIDALLCRLDGTKNKSHLGANTILGVSLACAQAGCRVQKVSLYSYIHAHLLGERGSSFSLPAPMMNILNGGRHASNAMSIQELMIIPLRSDSFSTALRMGCEVFHCLKETLASRGFPTELGDEGGFAPPIRDEKEGIELLLEAIVQAGYSSDSIQICIDAASNEFYNREHRHYRLGKGRYWQTEKMVSFWEDLVRQYPIFSIEDALWEDDWLGWQWLTSQLGDRVQIVGDDMFVTHPARLGRGIKEGVGNAILIKPNQIGTLSEVLSVISQAKKAHYRYIISHRSGETEDCTISDLSVGTHASQIKAGSLARSERTAKYNQLLRIEAHIKQHHGDNLAQNYHGNHLFRKLTSRGLGVRQEGAKEAEGTRERGEGGKKVVK